MEEMDVKEVTLTHEFKAAMQRLNNAQRGQVSVMLLAIEQALDALEDCGMVLQVTFEADDLDFE